MKRTNRPLLLVVLSALLALSLLGVGPPSSSFTSRYIVKIGMSDYRAHLKEIHNADIDVAGMNIPHATVDLIATAKELDVLQSLGIKFASNLHEIVNEAPDSKYKTPDQVTQILATMATTYPTLAQSISIGKSLQGRDIWAIRITSNVQQSDGSKPTILFNGTVHAREVMATEIPLDIADYLLSNYGKDAKVTQWLDTMVVYVIPMINPDGNNLVWTQDNMWRKNARGDYGVDIERNYPFQWNSCDGSSSDQGADDYRGPSAGSEPETNVMTSFVTSIHPVFDLSFHSYSELVIYPYGCGQHTETASVIEPLGAQLAAAIKSDDGNGTYTAGLAPDLLYSVDGDDIDWMYHEEHVIPYVIEVNSDSQGFQPSYDSWRESTVTRLRPAWMILMDRMNQSSVSGQVTFPKYSQMRPSVQVRLANSTHDLVSIYPVHRDGTFHAVVKPGDYQLTFSGPGIQSLVRSVHVGQKRLKLNVALSAAAMN